MPTSMTPAENRHLSQSLKFPLRFVAAIWLVHIAQSTFHLDLGDWGIYPRMFSGLRGMLFAPFLHGSWGHLAANTVPFFALSLSVFYFYPRVAARSMILMYFLSGLLVWIFADAGYHIGASYVVYAMLSFVFWNGIFRRSAYSIFLALLVLSIYGGMFSGIAPSLENELNHISWQSHLIGGLVGIFAAYYYKEELEISELTRDMQTEEAKQYFFTRDVFEKTLAERQKEEEERQLREWEARKNDNPYFGTWYTSSTDM
jgi:membrane associated rhomboid family serine protease